MPTRSIPWPRILAEGVVSVGLVALLASCGSDGPTDLAPTVISVRVTGPHSRVVSLGTGGPFIADATTSDGATTDVTTESEWSSSDTTVVTVTATGAGSAVGVGIVDVCATYQEVTGCFELAVVPPPPLGGTIFIAPDIISDADPTTFELISFTGREQRVMQDRRSSTGFIPLEPYVFQVQFDDGLTTEIQVNPEFGSLDAARQEAEKYAEVIGRMPSALRRNVDTVWTHKGREDFGGHGLEIHTDLAEEYLTRGILEETLLHVGVHNALDAEHSSAPGWLAAQSADARFISQYAQDHPDREDLAESFVPYLAVRFRSDRISVALADTIMAAIPNRMIYLDGLSLDMYPIQ